jgi:hypothetical protein
MPDARSTTLRVWLRRTSLSRRAWLSSALAIVEVLQWLWRHGAPSQPREIVLRTLAVILSVPVYVGMSYVWTAADWFVKSREGVVHSA